MKQVFVLAALVALGSVAPVEVAGTQARPRPQQAQQAQSQAQQDTSRRRARPDTTIPKSAIPPRGMCRIWLDGVPVSQQPAPTDCATAVRNRPAKGRVIFGDDYARDSTRRADSTKRLPIKGFAPSSRPKIIKPPR